MALLAKVLITQASPQFLNTTGKEETEGLPLLHLKGHFEATTAWSPSLLRKEIFKSLFLNTKATKCTHFEQPILFFYSFYIIQLDRESFIYSIYPGDIIP